MTVLATDSGVVARPPRIGLLDTVRGAALIAMATYHFSWDLEFMGYLTPGTVLTDSKRRHRAVVGADGSLKCGDAAGSIHKLGATLQNAPSCNGWTWWHYEDEGTLKPIDALRQTYLLATQP